MATLRVPSPLLTTLSSPTSPAPCRRRPRFLFPSVAAALGEKINVFFNLFYDPFLVRKIWSFFDLDFVNHILGTLLFVLTKMLNVVSTILLEVILFWYQAMLSMISCLRMSNCILHCFRDWAWSILIFWFQARFFRYCGLDFCLPILHLGYLVLCFGFPLGCESKIMEYAPERLLFMF